MSAPGPGISVEGLRLSLGGRELLKGISFDVPAGESLAIVGRSGSGKSLTMRCVLGLSTPDTAEILVDTQKLSPRTRPALLRRSGVVFQGGALFDSLDVVDNITFRQLRGPAPMRAPDRRALALELLERVGLPAEIAGLYPADLSGGMIKRVGIARALAGQPDMLFCDEPTSGLDPVTGAQINSLIRSVQTEARAPTITVTHDPYTVVRVADRVLLIDVGEVKWSGTVAEIRSQSHPMLQGFMPTIGDAED